MVAAKGNALYVGMRAEKPRPPVEGPNPILSLTRIELDGTITWSHTYQAGDADIGGMVVEHDGSLLVTGRFAQTIDFGGHVLTSHAPEVGDRWAPDIFVTRLDPSGNTVWAKRSVRIVETPAKESGLPTAAISVSPRSSFRFASHV